MPSIYSIAYKPQHMPRRPEGHFSRLVVEKARLIENYGIEGDVKGGHPSRQVNIAAREALDALKMRPGEMGEQIVVDGLDIESLAVGSHLWLGAACVEITAVRGGCLRFSQMHCLPEKSASGQLGVMAKVLIGGEICVGDPVQEAVLHV